MAGNPHHLLPPCEGPRAHSVHATDSTNLCTMSASQRDATDVPDRIAERKAARRADNRTDILDAAERVFGEFGIAGGSIRSIGADSGFAAERVWRAAERRRIAAYIPPQPTMLPKAGGEATTEAQRQALAARSRCKSPAGIEAHRRRMADAEGVIGELKNQGTAARARRRGTPHFHVQLLLNCTAVNCKRLADHAQQAQPGVAAAPPMAQTQPPTADAHPSRWLAELLAATPCAWDYAISLN